MSIAYYDAIIAECDRKIAKLYDSKSQVSSVIPYNSRCTERVGNVGPTFSNIILGKESFGKVELEHATKVSTTVENALSAILEECDVLIVKYTAKKESAIAAKAALIAKLEMARMNLKKSN